MKTRCLIYFLLCLYLASCGDTASGPDKKVQKDKSFYPVASIVQKELAQIDSLPIAVFVYTTTNDRNDTGIVDKKEFRSIALSFAEPDITREPLKGHYVESVFMDQTIHLVTLSYTSNNPADEIQKLEVYVNPDNDQVKSFYIEKIKSGGDSTLHQKLIWTVGKQLQVTSKLSREGLPAVTSQKKYSWDLVN